MLGRFWDRPWTRTVWARLRRRVGARLARASMGWGLALVLASAAAAAPLPKDGPEPASGRRGMVSSAHPLATEAGLAILARGGNAFDAAVAVAATLNVVEPYNSGMGGYGLILIYSREENRVRVLNSSGRIPQGVDSDVFRAPTPDYMAQRRGPKAISTPVNLRAWEALSREYGKLEWKDLFVPAIAAAQDGFVLLRDISPGAFEEFSAYSKAFYGRDGRPLRRGERLLQRDLGRSLQKVAREGSAALHGGELGRAIDAEMRRVGSFLRLRDLEASQAEWWPPIQIRYRGHTVVTASPPANSFTSLLRLGLMSQIEPGKAEHNSGEYLHRFAEVTKHAFWARLKYAGDPDVKPPPLDLLLSPDYWKKTVAGLDLHKARDFVPPGPTSAAGNDTTHFVVADAAGNVVSATQTLGNGYGSRVMAPGTGIWLNNSLYYCTFEPKGNPMDAHPGRRKLISNHPTFILKDGRPWVALGTPGGHTIGQTVAQMVLNILDFGMDIQAAIAAPRVAFAEPNTLLVEEGIAPGARRELTARGHSVRLTRRIGNAHGLSVEYDGQGKPVRFSGGADPRGQGVARGW